MFINIYAHGVCVELAQYFYQSMRKTSDNIKYAFKCSVLLAVKKWF